MVLAAHSCSAHMAMEYVRVHGDAEFDGFIGIGMGATDLGQPMSEPFPLGAMSVPVLDLFGDEDYPSVRERRPSASRQSRARGIRAPPSASSPVPTTSSATWDEELVDVVVDWLATLPDDD